MSALRVRYDSLRSLSIPVEPIETYFLNARSTIRSATATTQPTDAPNTTAAITLHPSFPVPACRCIPSTAYHARRA